MVIKKKRTYKKQKGGFVKLSEILKSKIYHYFDFVKYLINRIDFFLQKNILSQNRISQFKDDMELSIIQKNILSQNSISQFKHDMELSIRQHNDNILIQKLYQKIIYILQKSPNNLNRIHFLEKIGKCVLSDVFFSAPSNISNLTFTDILKKIFINILFIDYLKVDDIRRQNINEPNKLFEEKIINLLNKLFHITSFDDTEYLISLLRKLFLEEYQRIYGIPVFYGNTLDSYNNKNRLLGYNQFICEKVGISSKDKRNYIINPVGALAWMYIDKNDYLGTPLYNLLRKILRFDYVQGNKRRDSFTQLPKLEHLRQTITKFCIAIDMFNNEEVYQEPTDVVSMCSKLYGCPLKMTAAIRKENIASDEHILELLSILLEEELNKPIVKPIVELNINKIQTKQQELNNRARFFVEQPDRIMHKQFINERNREINLNKRITTSYGRGRDNDKYFEKLQEEAYKLINNTKNNKNDILKIQKLLIIIEDLETLQYNKNLNEYYKINIPPIIYEVKKYLTLRLSYLTKNKTNEFYNTSTNTLLNKENYNTTLDKIYREASILTRNTRKYNPYDIRKIKKLLEIIKKIKSNKIKRFNFDNDMYQKLQERLDSTFHPVPNLSGALYKAMRIKSAREERLDSIYRLNNYSL
jgi:hypothetical protein